MKAGNLPWAAQNIQEAEMGDKGGKKNKEKAQKQKSQQTDKKKEQQISKLPAKKP